MKSISEIQNKAIVAEFKGILQKNTTELEKALASPALSCKALLWMLDEMDAKISAVWYPLQYFMLVAFNPELQEIYQNCAIALGGYASAMGQNQKLFEKMHAFLQNQVEQKKLNSVESELLQKNLLTFKLSGIGLSTNLQEVYSALQQKHNMLMQKFDENVMQSTHSWFKSVERKDLQGLPEDVIAFTTRLAKFKNQEGHLLSLDEHCYTAVMRYADSRELRQEIYTAYMTRCTELGNPDWDNTAVMQDILGTREGIALLLGYANYAEFALSSRMLKTQEEVMGFLNQLLEKAQHRSAIELRMITQVANQRGGLTQLEPWDLDYYAEILRSEYIGINDRQLRQYFPLDHVLTGLFSFVSELFKIRIEEVTDFERWHPSVQCFSVFDHADALVGQIYFDPFMRPFKRDSMWTEQLSTHRIKPDGQVERPVAIVTCNFRAPADNAPCLLNLEGLRVLFHEFGHAFHHILSKVEYASLSGLNGLPLDGIEIPSFFFENWYFQEEILRRITKHVKTGKKLHQRVMKNLERTKNFPNALQLLQRVKKALFDMQIHQQSAEKSCLLAWQEVSLRVDGVSCHPLDRFPNSFALIFSSGYAAGYYSYIWSELMASDLFESFVHNGLFDRANADKFLHEFWERGGASDLRSAFVKFCGHAPQIDALLRQRRIN